MSELRIVRGTDVKLYADDTPLFGVTAVSAKEKPSYHAVYEYLSAAPCEYIPQGSRYEIEISMMSLFSDQFSGKSGFVFRIADGETSYHYENCRVIEQKTVLDEKNLATERIILEADSMRKRCGSDA